MLPNFPPDKLPEEVPTPPPEGAELARQSDDTPPPALATEASFVAPQQPASGLSAIFRTKATRLREQLLQEYSSTSEFTAPRAQLEAVFGQLAERDLSHLKTILESSDSTEISNILKNLISRPLFSKEVLIQTEYFGRDLTKECLQIQDSRPQGQISIACSLLAEKNNDTKKLQAHLILKSETIDSAAEPIVSRVLEDPKMQKGAHALLQRLSPGQVRSFLNLCVDNQQRGVSLTQFHASCEFVDSLNANLFEGKLKQVDLEQLVNVFFQNPKAIKSVQNCLSNLNLFRKDLDIKGTLLHAKKNTPSKFENDLAQLHACAHTLSAEQIPSFLKVSNYFTQAANMEAIAQLTSDEKLITELHQTLLPQQTSAEDLTAALAKDPKLATLIKNCFVNLLVFDSRDALAQAALIDRTQGGLSKFEKDISLLHAHIAQSGGEQTPMLMELATRLSDFSNINATLQLIDTSARLLQSFKESPVECLRLAQLTAQINQRFNHQMPQEDQLRLMHILLQHPQTAEQLQEHCQSFDRYLEKYNPLHSKTVTSLELQAQHRAAIHQDLIDLKTSLSLHAASLEAQLAPFLENFSPASDAFVIKEFLRTLQNDPLAQQPEVMQSLATVLDTLNLEPDEFFAPRASNNDENMFLRDVYLEYRERALLSNTQIIEEALGRYYYSTKMPFEQLPSDSTQIRSLFGQERVKLARCTPEISGRRSFSLSTQIVPTTSDEKYIALTLKEPSGASILYKKELPQEVDLAEFFNGLMLGTDKLTAEGKDPAFIQRIKDWSLDAEKGLQQARQDVQHPEPVVAAQSKEQFLSQVQVGRIYARENTQQLALTQSPPAVSADLSVIDPTLLHAVQEQVNLLTLVSDQPSIQIDLPTLDGQSVTIKLNLNTQYREQASTFYQLSSHFTLGDQEFSQVSYLPISEVRGGRPALLAPEVISQKMQATHFLECHLLQLQAKILKA